MNVPAETTVSLLEWIERLGGWGAVLLIVRWMMRQSDDERALFRSAVEEFRGYRKNDEEAHRAMAETHAKMLDNQAKMIEHLANR